MGDKGKTTGKGCMMAAKKTTRKKRQGAKYTTRDPRPTTRDPKPEQHEAPKMKPRRCIPANMPTICPECGHNTRMNGGRYVDPVHGQIVEYRDCVKCDERLAAPRPMTEREREKHCTHVEAVAEYQQMAV